ncbi:S1 family peptidase [Streptomyces sp. enrichment culture]|uniref:S1 family peptidase n=1 Tax=Streptomyces sp. enrichment culture TaxID=1795815 RepID=UPI003F5592A9
MTGGTALRTVEVSNRHKQSYGTGCLIAPGLVLTAYHVALPAADGVVAVRDLASASFTEAVVVWESPELDAVLLKADRASIGAGMSVVRWGELVCDYPARRPTCSMTGFPKAMRRRASARSEQYVDDLKTVEGTIAPHTGSRSRLYALEVDGAVPAEVKNWQGLSGAGVFCEGTLVGFAHLVDRQWDRCIMALPVSRLLAADGFSRTVATHTGMTPRLQPADLRPLLDNLPDPALSSSHLLDPRSRVVGLTGMSELTRRIEQWCKGTDRIDVAAVTGLGGTGKSRLVTEILHRLTASSGDQRPWSGGFLAENPSHTDYRMLTAASYPLLLAVDLAETRLPQIRDLTAALADTHDGVAIRVLLLARRHDTWWPEMRRHLRTRNLGTVRETFTLTPSDALNNHSPEDIYVEAKAAFARRIRLLQQAGHGDDTWPESIIADAPRHYGAGIEHAPQQPVIYHHIAALADVLAHANPDFALKDHPMEVLLANEEEYVRRIAEARLPQGTIDAKLIRTLVTAQFLAGARTARDGRAAVRAAFDAHHRGYGATAPPDARQLAALDDILTAAYPATDGAHWGAIGTPLADAWLAEVETDSGDEFIETFLTHEALATEQRHQTLSTIARTAQDKPELAAGAQRAVAADPELLLPLAAQTVTAELSTDHARQWLSGLKHAVTARSTYPDADSDTYQWAISLISDAEEWTDAEEDNFVDLMVSSLISQAQDRATDENDQAELTGASLAREDDFPARPGADAGPVPLAATSHLLLVKPQVGWLTRIVVTFLGLCHLVLVTAVSAAGAITISAKDGDGWIMWMLVPFNLFMHLTVASAFGSRQLGTLAFSWIVPLITVGITTMSGLMLYQHWPSHWPPPWLVWPALFASGLAALTYAWRFQFGQLQDTRRPADV